MKYENLTGAIIGAYYEVYNHTSRTYPEYIYERAMIHELRSRGLPCTQQDEYKIFYKNCPVGIQRLDLFVVQEVVVENKVADKLTKRHKAQCISYLKTVNKPIGLLINFGSAEPNFHRLYFDFDKRPENVTHAHPEPDADWLYPDLACKILGALYEVHHVLGAGFVHRIYANACHYELKSRNFIVEPIKRVQVAYKDTVIGDIAFGHLLVEGKIMIFPVAIREVEDIHLDDLKTWMRWRNIQLGILANFDDVRLSPVFVRA
ncbi:MAG: GxxExxY protein [Anaerolineae bacterium]|nr:GxxExxY protein [Anaerolineae bacterium]